MPPRGNRLACSVRSLDGCLGSYDVYPGEQPNSVAKVDPIKWDREPQKGIQEGAFTVIGDMGMTGQVILVNHYQWRALAAAKLEIFFYAAILWGKSPFKVIADAEFMAKRAGK
jgi:hypothetical protein